MHRCSVFTNSCLKVPVDPFSKMPKTAYERSENIFNSEQVSIDSSTTVSMSGEDLDVKKLKDFYRSIPDYSDINHLPTSEFYSTLKSLREKKKVMMGLATELIDHDKIYDQYFDDMACSEKLNKNIKKETKLEQRRKSCLGRDCDSVASNNAKKLPIGNFSKDRSVKAHKDMKNSCVEEKNTDDVQIPKTKHSSLVVTGTSKMDRPKRNHSACSISWHDDKIERKNEIDEKFDKFFERGCNSNLSHDDTEYKTQSMPSSPLRSQSKGKIKQKYKNITIPKPFKMTERDEEDRIVSELRMIQKSFSDDMLNQKVERKTFKARPVPIESRIPLYDKILEDQAMRRAITKINSEAELRARMKPFSFTKREENCNNDICERAEHVLPKNKKKKRFKARPVPKNLFSNYFYDKVKEDNFFRSMNRRIRAEEMLRNASFPGNMALRERSRLSTPAAHSDLPMDPSLAGASVSSGENLRPTSPTKGLRKSKNTKENFVTTSPQPFRFNTADRANKKMQDIQKKVCQGSNCTDSSTRNQGISEPTKAYSALDLNSIAVGRSNLAALLRAEAVRRRFEQEAARRLAEQRRKSESKYRDRQLRSKPAWHLVKNNHEEDIAMRLQTRRDEERLRREEFLHEMELMYGRVQQQPMLFERYYAPRPPNTEIDFSQLSPRKSPKKKTSRKKKTYHILSPSRSSDFQDDVMKYLVKNDKFYEDEDVIDSLERS